MCDFKSWKRPCDRPNPSGTKNIIYLSPVDNITNIPKLKSEMTPPGILLGDKVTIGEEYEMVATKFFVPYQIIPLTGQVKDVAGGEIGGMTWTSTLDFKLQGSDAEVLEFAATILNAPMIGIAPEKSGQRRAMGDIENWAWVSAAEVTTGMAAADLRAATFTITSVQGIPAPVYDKALEIPLAA